MLFTLEDSWTLATPALQTSRASFLDRWNSFVSRESDAIRELKGIESGARNRELELLRQRMSADLPEVIPADIIDHDLMQGNNDRFRAYIERETLVILRAAVDSVMTSNREHYRTMLTDIVRDHPQKAHLGNYFFEVQSFDLTLTIDDAAHARFIAVFNARVTVDADRTTADVDTDTVGLQALASEIKDLYLYQLKDQLNKDVESQYSERVRRFETNNLGPALRDLGTVLH